MRTGTEQVQAAEIRCTAEMTALEPEWQHLASVCLAATVFQTYEWNAAWWRHFGRTWGRRLRVVTFRTPDGYWSGLRR